MLARKTVLELLDAFSSPAPTPGGGSAAALAGAVAASLLAMVAGMPRTRSGTPEDREALDAALDELMTTRGHLVGLIDRDAAAYDNVVAAYRLPKETEADKAARKLAIAEAMRTATDAPLETARAAAALVSCGRQVAEHGNVNAKSDVSVAISLAMTAFSGGMANVEANLGSVGDEAYVGRVRRELAALAKTIAEHVKPAYEALGWTSHEPPRA
jgi:formiminotetrahydrofolate cyclodeaminase